MNETGLLLYRLFSTIGFSHKETVCVCVWHGQSKSRRTRVRRTRQREKEISVSLKEFHLCILVWCNARRRVTCIRGQVSTTKKEHLVGVLHRPPGGHMVWATYHGKSCGEVRVVC